jgi:hypothetical protein
MQRSTVASTLGRAMRASRGTQPDSRKRKAWAHPGKVQRQDIPTGASMKYNVAPHPQCTPGWRQTRDRQTAEAWCAKDASCVEPVQAGQVRRTASRNHR